MSELACINIGPRQRTLRLRLGIVMLVVALVLGLALTSMNAPRALRVLLFAPLLMAALGFFQAQSHTCVALAAKGLRNMDRGNEPVPDSDESLVLKARARSIVIRSVAVAAIVTLAFLLF